MAEVRAGDFSKLASFQAPGSEDRHRLYEIQSMVDATTLSKGMPAVIVPAVKGGQSNPTYRQIRPVVLCDAPKTFGKCAAVAHAVDRIR